MPKRRSLGLSDLFSGFRIFLDTIGDFFIEPISGYSNFVDSRPYKKALHPYLVEEDF